MCNNYESVELAIQDSFAEAACTGGVFEVALLFGRLYERLMWNLKYQMDSCVEVEGNDD